MSRFLLVVPSVAGLQWNGEEDESSLARVRAVMEHAGISLSDLDTSAISKDVVEKLKPSLGKKSASPLSEAMQAARNEIKHEAAAGNNLNVLNQTATFYGISDYVKDNMKATKADFEATWIAQGCTVPLANTPTTLNHLWTAYENEKKAGQITNTFKNFRQHCFLSLADCLESKDVATDGNRKCQRGRACPANLKENDGRCELQTKFTVGRAPMECPEDDYNKGLCYEHRDYVQTWRAVGCARTRFPHNDIPLKWKNWVKAGTPEKVLDELYSEYCKKDSNLYCIASSKDQCKKPTQILRDLGDCAPCPFGWTAYPSLFERVSKGCQCQGESVCGKTRKGKGWSEKDGKAVAAFEKSVFGTDASWTTYGAQCNYCGSPSQTANACSGFGDQATCDDLCKKSTSTTATSSPQTTQSTNVLKPKMTHADEVFATTQSQHGDLKETYAVYEPALSSRNSAEKAKTQAHKDLTDKQEELTKTKKDVTAAEEAVSKAETAKNDANTKSVQKQSALQTAVSELTAAQSELVKITSEKQAAVTAKDEAQKAMTASADLLKTANQELESAENKYKAAKESLKAAYQPFKNDESTTPARLHVLSPSNSPEVSAQQKMKNADEDVASKKAAMEKAKAEYDRTRVAYNTADEHETNLDNVYNNEYKPALDKKNEKERQVKTAQADFDEKKAIFDRKSKALEQKNTELRRKTEVRDKAQTNKNKAQKESDEANHILLDKQNDLDVKNNALSDAKRQQELAEMAYGTADTTFKSKLNAFNQADTTLANAINAFEEKYKGSIFEEKYKKKNE